MIAIHHRELNEAESSLGSALYCDVGKAPLVGALAAEHMRALIYGCGLSQRNLGWVRTIHTTRLLTSARRVVDLVWPEYANRSPESDVCAVTLQCMEGLGDTVSVGGGQRLAAPLRIVVPDKADRYLLVGAAPAEPAHLRLGAPPTCAAATRFVDSTAFEAAGSDDLLISADDWFGETHALSDWTALVLASHEPRMGVIGGLSAEQLEIYAPDVAGAQRRPGRWMPAAQIGRSLEGIRLCRPQVRYAQSWDRPSYLATFNWRNGVLALRHATRVSNDLTLRLRFGLDVHLQTPRRLTIARQNKIFSIDRPLTLPQPEKRVYALGWHDSVSQFESEKLTFHIDALPIVVRGLQRLSVDPTIVHRSTA